MRGGRTQHAHSHSETLNHRAQLAKAYQDLGKELSSTKIRILGNYTLGKVIGEGTYGKVRIGTHRLTSTRVAIKQIPKELSAQLTREIHHHRRLHHPHVTQLYEVIATESSIWLVTELCSGGELFDYLVEKGRLGEAETRKMFGQLCLAMHYVHESGAVHRDLKLENVLLDDRCNVKIGDFGFTREFEQGRLLETFCGTTGYAAPEMLLGQKYSGPEVDIWSLGIILHCLLTGTLPFDDDDEDAMKTKIIIGDFEDSEWLSENAQDLLRGILRKSPSDRLTIPQILSHPWFIDPEPSSYLASPPPLDLNAVASTTEFQLRSDSPSSPSPFFLGSGPSYSPSQPRDLVAAVNDAFRGLDEVASPSPSPSPSPMDPPESSESSSMTSASDAPRSDNVSDENSASELTSVTTPDIHPSPILEALETEQQQPLEYLLGSQVASSVSRSGSQSTLGKTPVPLIGNPPGGAGVRTQPASRLSLTSKQSDSTAFAVVVEEGEETEDQETPHAESTAPPTAGTSELPPTSAGVPGGSVASRSSSPSGARKQSVPLSLFL